jgi:hypothetical protein
VAKAFPELRNLPGSTAVAAAAKLCVGLDGRRIRKIVIAAMALNKEVALSPSKLTGDRILEAARQARAEAGLDGVKRLSTVVAGVWRRYPSEARLPLGRL